MSGNFTTRIPAAARAARVAGVLLGVSLSGASLVASAQEPSPALEQGYAARPEPPSDRSPQNMAFELRLGPYLPRVDRSTDQPIFSEFFGGDDRFMLGFEIDWQLWRIPHVGPVGVGVGLGYTNMSAPNRIPAGSDTAGGNATQDSTLTLLPTFAVGVLRVDTLMREFGIPLVPYGKLGIAHAFWWVDDGIGTAEDAGVSGKDTSTGTQMALGGMFLLDVIEPTTARSLDADAGINNSYLFFEWSVSDYTGAQMNVGDSTWVTGLALEL